MNKNILYTAIFNNKDKVKTPLYVNDNFDYALFVDELTFDAQKNKINDFDWNVTVLPNSNNPRLSAKEIKILSHKYVSKYRTSIWVDGSFRQIGDLNHFLEISDENMVLMNHPIKNCIYKEAKACINLNMDNEDVITEQTKRYLSEDYPPNNGLNMCGIILRRKNRDVSLFNNKWWKEIINGSIRDQISFPYVKWKSKLNISSINYSEIENILQNQPHLK